jgi:hypothetical protein
MKLWIDIENSSGSKLGGGPVAEVSRWTQTARLDQAGEFSFEMPANSDAASTVQVKRVAHCYGLVNGVVTDLGMGIIDKKSIRGGMLVAEGSDLLRELTYRSVGALEISKQVAACPQEVQIIHPGDDLDLPLARDGNLATSSSFQMTLYEPAGDFPGDWKYIGASVPFSHYTEDYGARVNSVSSSTLLQYYNGVSGGWADLSASDTRTVAGVPYAQSGSVTYAKIEDWACHSASNHYIIRERVFSNLNVVDLAEVTIYVSAPTDTALADVSAFFPTGWGYDGGYSLTQNDVYLQLDGENCLEALVKIAEVTGEHFRLGTGRNVVWLQDDPLTSTYVARAVKLDGADPADVLSGSDRIGITGIERVEDTYELFTRIYPRGAGFGSAQVTLERTTKTAASPYALSASNNYIVNNDAEITYGRIDKWAYFRDIAAAQNVEPDITLASDALYDVAYHDLRHNSQANQAYTLEIVAPNTIINPGQRLRVVYTRFVDGVAELNVNEDLIVLEATNEIDSTGVRTTAVQVSTVDAWPRNDDDVLVGLAEDMRTLSTKPQAVNGIDLQTFGHPHSLPEQAITNYVLTSIGPNTFWRAQAAALGVHDIAGSSHNTSQAASNMLVGTTAACTLGWIAASSLGGIHDIVSATHTTNQAASNMIVGTTAACTLGWIAASTLGGGSSGYDIGDGIRDDTMVASGATVNLLTFVAPRAFDITDIGCYCNKSDALLNIYIDTANPAIVATRNASSAWTIDRHNPTTGSLIASASGGSADSTGIITIATLSVTDGQLYRADLVNGAGTLTQFAYGLKGTEV